MKENLMKELDEVINLFGVYEGTEISDVFIGKSIIVTNAPEDYRYFQIGSTGELIHRGEDGQWWAVFEKDVDGDYIWCLDEKHAGINFRIIGENYDA